MDAKTGLVVALGAFTLFYVVVFAMGLRKAASEQPGSTTPTISGLIVGAVTNFFDTLGIGSYAPTTSAFRFWKMVPDEQIPGTLNVGHTLPTITEAFIFITAIAVEPTTLIALIAAAVVGAWLGAGVVAGLSRRAIQIGMGCALVAGAALFALKNVDAMRATPVFPGGEAIGLSSTLLIVGIIGSAVLCALMTLGIGFYAPCMIMIALLGMNPKSAFPIMMGACAFLMPVASARFVRLRKFDAKAAVGLAVGGIPAVLIAAYIVKQLPLVYVRWGVVLVVLYAAVGLLRTAAKEKAARA